MHAATASSDTQHPDQRLSHALGSIATAWRPFGFLAYTWPNGAEMSTARIYCGAEKLASARGKTPAAACRNLLRRLAAMGVQVPS